MCLMKLPIPTNLVDRTLLTGFHMETMLFCYRTALSMEISHRILSAFSASSTEVKKVSDKFTAGDVGPSTGYHTHSNT